MIKKKNHPVGGFLELGDAFINGHLLNKAALYIKTLKLFCACFRYYFSSVRVRFECRALPVEYGAGWCSLSAPRVQLAEPSGAQPGLELKPVRIGLYWNVLV